MPATAPIHPPLDRRDRLLALGLGMAAAALYIGTACPTVYVGDSGELIAAATCGGVVHPPGYPLWSIVHTALLAVLPGAPAWTMNVLTSVWAAAAVAVVFVTARRSGAGRTGAAAGAVALATALPFWAQATSTEVYALDALLLALACCAATTLFHPSASPAAWWWFGLLAGLSVGHRPPNALDLGLLALAVAWTRRTLWRDRGGWTRAGLAALATSLLFLWLPIRAAADPPLDMGDPDTLARFFGVVRAAPYERHLGAVSLPRIGLGLGVLGSQAALVPFSLLGAWKLGRGSRAGRGLAVACLAIVAANVLFVSAYRILDVDGYWQPSLVVLALLAAHGYGTVANRLGRVAPLLLLVPLGHGAWVAPAASLRDVHTVSHYADDLLAGADEDALVLVTGDTARAALIEVQVVDGRRPDVAALAPGMLVPWHVAEVRARAPGARLPALGDRDDPQRWLQREVAARMHDQRPVYCTDPGALAPWMLPEDLLRRMDLVPSGLLYRLVVLPREPIEAPAAEAARARSEAFWQNRPLPMPPTARADPQLVVLPVHYAEARLLHALSLVVAGRLAEARPHLTAVAESDVDAREERVAADYLAIGRHLQPRHFAARA